MGRGDPDTAAIRLLLADVVMPQMRGRQTAVPLNALQSGSKCPYISGDAADVIAHRGILEEGVSFIGEPFLVTVRAEKVREVLDG